MSFSSPLRKPKVRANVKKQLSEEIKAFLAVLLAIVLLNVLAIYLAEKDGESQIVQAIVRVLDTTAAGLVAILGMAAQSLFKTAKITTEQINVDQK